MIVSSSRRVVAACTASSLASSCASVRLSAAKWRVSASITRSRSAAGTGSLKGDGRFGMLRI